jgi:hypothetical protein
VPCVQWLSIQLQFRLGCCLFVQFGRGVLQHEISASVLAGGIQNFQKFLIRFCELRIAEYVVESFHVIAIMKEM